MSPDEAVTNAMFSVADAPEGVSPNILSAPLAPDIRPTDVLPTNLRPQTPYEKSRLSGSAIEAYYEEQADRLFNDKKPQHPVLHEQPEHRTVIFLKAQGLSNNEIAKRTGYTFVWISQVLRQPWARVRLLTELREAGRPAVQALLRASAEDSVMTLIAVRDTATRPSDKIAAANSLLDRCFGKPTQHIEEHASDTVLPSSIDDIDREMASLAEQEKRLLNG